jgi:hypothetical protein
MFGKGSDASNYYDEEVRPQAYHDIIMILLCMYIMLSLCVNVEEEELGDDD